MGLPGKIAALGDIMQLAFVPEDFDAAVKHWTETMGVGPFFLIEGIHLEGMKYRGQPTDAVFDLALAYWGDLQTLGARLRGRAGLQLTIFQELER